MIGLDTNVLVRFLVEDDDDQTERAVALVRAAVSSGDQLFVCEVVLCEVIWVLARVYRLTKDELIKTVRTLLQARELHVRERESVRRALDAFTRGKGDFADYLIREVALAEGCERVATFDKALLRESSFFRP